MGPMRYSAFISYNHRDRAAAQRLLKTLESWPVPQRLQGRETPWGPLGPRLAPVFRDRDELATSADLAESVRQALAQSANLIVICSPAAARSKWVNAEIREFARIGRRQRIQCLILGGVHMSGDPETECLPPALFENGGSEPLAADLRPGADSWGDARLKLIAGLLDLPFNDLKQRELQRRQRRLALVAGASAIGFAGMTGLAAFALVSRAEAVRQRDIAREKTATAERTVDFVKSLFQVSDPSEAMGRTISAREILDAGARRIETELADEPTVRAELATTLGEVYAGLGLFGEGARILGVAEGLPGLPAETRARQAAARGEALARQGDYGGAVAAFDRGLSLVAGLEQAGSLEARLLVGRADSLSAQGDHAAAEQAIARALALEVARVGSSHPDVARVQEARALNAFFAGDYDRARRALEAALPIRQRQGARHPKVSEGLNMLGAIAYRQGDNQAAEAYARQALAIDREVLGLAHPDVAMTANMLGRIMLERRAFGEAHAILADALAVSLKERPATHDDMAWLFANMALAEYGLGRSAQAEGLLRQALVAADAHGHRNRGPILVDLADLLCARGATGEAAALLARAAPLMKADWPEEPWRQAWRNIVAARCAGRPPAPADRAIVQARWPRGTLYADRLDG
jgi:tetratricopeptide (TPR) repeat protein